MDNNYIMNEEQYHSMEIYELTTPYTTSGIQGSSYVEGQSASAAIVDWPQQVCIGPGMHD